MVAPTTCALEYTISLVGTLSITELTTLFGAVILPTDDLLNIGMSLTSDVTTAISGTVVSRTLTFSLLPIFKGFPVITPHAAYPGSIVSSSPNDTNLGTGMWSATVKYLDNQPVPIPSHESPAMNGTTPVNLIHTMSEFTSVAGAQFGSLGTNDGLVQVFSGINAKEDVIGQILGNFQGSIVSTSNADTASGSGLQTVQITYHDKTGAGPFTETVSLNGTTPVNLVTTNKAVINNIVATAIGTGGGNVGTVTVMSGLNLTGGPVGRLLPSFFSYFPINTALSSPDLEVALSAPVNDYFTHILTAAMVSYVTAHTPVFA